MTILLDPRFGETRGRSGAERRAAFKAALESFGATVEDEILEFGDLAFLGNGPDGPLKIGIELKAIGDLITSMRTKRLKGWQVPGLLVSYQRRYLIVEGFYRAGRPSGVLEIPRGRRWLPYRFGRRPLYWADLEKFLTGLEEDGVRVRRTRTPHETARVVVQVLESYWAKNYDAHRRSADEVYIPQLFTHEDEVTARLRRVCVALKTGIGAGKSRDVARRFRSIYGLVTADAGQWADLEGIGKTIMGNTMAAVHAEIGHVSSDQLPEGDSAPPECERRIRRGEDDDMAAGGRAQRGVHGRAAGRRNAR